MANVEQFDAVIVGSGFGGSVMAYELAAAGLRVCLLERGRRYPPDSFPRAPHAVARNFWDPSEGRYGMFDVWSFRHSSALVSSAFGGGSIIYANVLIRKPEAWFVERRPDGSRRPWPVSREDLEPHYEAVERMLGANPYPADVAPYDATPKTLAFQEAARQLRLTWYRPNLAVSFGNRGRPPVPGEPLDEPPNLHGRQRFACRLCGECDLGCNYGSKNTLDYNYLTRARECSADLRHHAEVRSFRRRDGFNWEVQYVEHDPDRWEGRKHDTQKLEPRTIAGRRLILAAGTFGSTLLLLRNRRHLPGVSRCLGTRYSSNGDLLTFAFRCMRADAGGARVPRILDPSFGPVITSTIEVPTGPAGEPDIGFYIQDAGYPQFVSWLAEATDAPGWIRRTAGFIWRRLRERLGGQPQSQLGGELSRLLGAGALSSSSTPLLAMGRDVGDGVFSLRGNDGRFLELSWRRRSSAAYFDYLTSTAQRVAETLGGSFAETPLAKYLDRLVTVHPVGGCPMGHDAGDGVVDSHGQVFNLPGLYVADGSVMPGAVGPNPSLTIAALSRRFAHGIIAGK